uniref:Trichoplein keratin filament binding protein n=1 Tax=Echinococcus granulosus TaxID=6210 RepID=A0A068WNN5_ECHGR|nr:trichoplein keratin filament binding protein [Echinococcus granulosus]
MRMMPNVRTKNIYEAVMHRQKMAEAKKQCEQIENKRFFQDSDVRARQEKRWTSETSFNNSMMAYLLPDKETVLSNLEARKSKLRSLLRKEADFYENEQFSTKRSLVTSLHNGMAEKLDSMNGQSENAMSDGEASGAVESKTVVYDSHRSDGRQRDVALQRKLDELKQFERETEELERIEKEALEDQKLLQRLATERLETDETRRQRRFEKVLLRQHTAALIRRSRQVQTEITTDLAWIDRLLAFEGEEEGKAEGEGPRSRINVVKEMLEEDLRHEARRERDMDDMLASEAAELAKRREQKWKCQEEARERLLNDVLSMCQDRVDSRLQALKQMKLARAERHEALKREINAAELQWKPPFQMEQSNDKDCDKLVKTEEANSRSSHAEAVFEETLRKEAEKLNISVDELKKVASGMGFSKAPFTGNQHKTQLW